MTASNRAAFLDRITAPGTATPNAEGLVALGKHIGAIPDSATLDLGRLHSRVEQASRERPDMDAARALATRLYKGREKIAKAEALNANPGAIADAKRKIAELDDELTEMMRAEARHYALSMAYTIGRDFLTDLHRACTEGTLTMHLPGARLSFTLVLDGVDDSPPF